MAAKPINPVTEQMIVADWRTGEYSQQDLADKYKISKGKTNNLCKGVEQDMTAIVTAGVHYRQGLAGQNDRLVTAVIPSCVVKRSCWVSRLIPRFRLITQMKLAAKNFRK